MSKQSLNSVFDNASVVVVKETIRTLFFFFRRIPSVSQKAASIEERLINIDYNISLIERKLKERALSSCRNMPALRSIDEVIASTSEKLVYLLGGLMVEGGIYVLFAHKGQGKSTFAMQMGLALARGDNMPIFKEYNLPSNTNPQHVIYLDYELSEMQIKKRYPEPLSSNFYWVGPCQSSTTSDLMRLIEGYIRNFPDGENVVLFIDNLTKIGGGYSQPVDAKDLYAKLNGFKVAQRKEHGRTITIVLVTHTQKDVKMGTAITQNNYSGAQDIIISADGVFAIGTTNFGNDTKLFKVLNNRNTKEPDTVSVIKHVDKPYSHFEVIDEMAEEDALAGRILTKQPPNGKSVRETTEPKYPPLTITQVAKMKEMLEEINPDTGKKYTQKEFAKYYGIPEAYVGRYLKGQMKPVPDSGQEEE